jgi:histidine ammonia-lyase
MGHTKTFEITADPIDLKGLYEILHDDHIVELSQESRQAVEECRQYLNEKIDRERSPIYGINTGFGSLCDISIEGKDLSALQFNLVRSHASGSGRLLHHSLVKLMLFLKARSLSFGHSGISLDVLERLLYFYNHGLFPKVYEQGSLGASGDLAPLAHLSLPLLGEGEFYFDGKSYPASDILRQEGLTPLVLQSKEGLALLNGTQFMSGIGLDVIMRFHRLSYLADVIGALSLEAFDGRPEPFDVLIHNIRPHTGQLVTAMRFNEFLDGSEMISRTKKYVQDPYSFRCIPQVHGASKDVLYRVRDVFVTEMNSVTDNPTIFPKQDKIISGGNFHGQTLALNLDYLAMAMAELANISERRTYLLVSGQRELPPFLVAVSGLNSGLMIAQYTAASIVSQNKQLCTPASVDSIVSSNGQEDHVSMGANAATKALQIVENLETVLAIELIAASQAFYFRQEKSSEFLMAFLEAFREKVSFIEKDRVLSEDIAAAKDFLSNIEIEPEILFGD